MTRIACRQLAARTSHKISRKTAVHTAVSTSLYKEARCDRAVAESERCGAFGYYTECLLIFLVTACISQV